MSVIRVGSTGSYAEGWEAIFGGGTKRKAAMSGTKKGASATKKKAKRGGGKPAAVKTKRRK
jgi:hypothetical protein